MTLPLELSPFGNEDSLFARIDRLLPDELQACLRAYLQGEPEWSDAVVQPDNPFIRPIRGADVARLDLRKPLPLAQLASTSALVAHQLLLNIYEADLMFLPSGSLGGKRRDMARFYSGRRRALGEILRESLEGFAFDELERATDVGGRWNADALRAYMTDYRDTVGSTPNVVLAAIRRARDPERAMKGLLAQLACDYLTEASAMARNVLGAYGETQSELFKVLIDEYGYGVHGTKHSTLYEMTLTSAGLASNVHAYWRFFLPSTLALGNYFHFVSKDHSRFFRYVGALFATEVTLRRFCADVAALIPDIAGAVDVRYFAEHDHIDHYHGTMVAEKIAQALVTQYGPEIIPDLVKGMAEATLLMEMADADLATQILWSDALTGNDVAALHDVPCEGRLVLEVGASDGVVTMVAETNVLITAAGAATELWHDSVSPFLIADGQTLAVPAGRLFSLSVTGAVGTASVKGAK